MKTNFFLTSIIIVLFSITANSQITKGNWMVGGDAYYSYDKYNSTSETWSIYFSPNVGYFFLDKLAVGIKPTFGIAKKSKAGYGIDVFTRYYFLKSTKIINFFIEPKGGISYSKSRGGDSINSYNYGIKAGQALFLNQSVALEFFMDYNNRAGSYKNIKSNSQRIFFGFGLQIHLEKDK